MFFKQKKLLKKKKRISVECFLFLGLGIITGAVSLIVFVLLLLQQNPHGISINLDGEKIFNVISHEVESQVQKEFPDFIREVRSEVPFLVEKYMQEDFIEIGTLEIGGYLVQLPDPFIRELENDLRNDVAYYVYELLNELEDEQFISELSQSVTNDVISSLFVDLHGQVIRVPFTRHYSIPVVVWLN
jgi:hypothetical protein